VPSTFSFLSALFHEGTSDRILIPYRRLLHSADPDRFAACPAYVPKFGGDGGFPRTELRIFSAKSVSTGGQTQVQTGNHYPARKKHTAGFAPCSSEDCIRNGAHFCASPPLNLPMSCPGTLPDVESHAWFLHRSDRIESMGTHTGFAGQPKCV
jgi:hypothetical protein